MALGSLGRGLMQSQREAQLPIIAVSLLQHFWDLSEREDLLELQECVLETDSASILVL